MARTAESGTRERIVAAAIPLFYNHGIRAVGMSRLIEAAGCGKNLLYSHFPSKTDLVAAYLSATRRARERETAAAVSAAGSPAAQLIALTAEIADRVREPGFRGCAMRNYLTEFPGDDDAPARIARDYLAASRAQVEALAGNPARADRIWLVIDGLYASANRPDAARQASAAVGLVSDLVR